jgi:AcrR family transcriptional regulator
MEFAEMTPQSEGDRSAQRVPRQGFPNPDGGKTVRTRRRIVSVAHELFTQHGFNNVTVRKIADAVGITERTVYRHFASKDDLLLAWMDEVVPMYIEHVRERPLVEDHLTACCAAFVSLVGEGDDSPVSPHLAAIESAGGASRARAIAKLADWEGALSACLAERGGEDPLSPSTSSQLAAAVSLTTIRCCLRHFLVAEPSSRGRGLDHRDLAQHGQRSFAELCRLMVTTAGSCTSDLIV